MERAISGGRGRLETEGDTPGESVSRVLLDMVTLSRGTLVTSELEKP